MQAPLSALSPIEQQKSASERVGEQIRELIASGNLAPGEKLPSENELSRALQVSRPVVREALRGLSMLGLVESRQGGGCYVTDLHVDRLMEPLSFFLRLNEHSLDDLFEARAMIDCGQAKAAAARATEDQKARLLEMAQIGFDLVDDPVGFRVMDAQFHSLISEAAGNAFLNSVAQSFYSLAMDARRRASTMPGVLEQSAKDHDAIAKAIVAGDGRAASAAMDQHVNNIRLTTLAARNLREDSADAP